VDPYECVIQNRRSLHHLSSQRKRIITAGEGGCMHFFDGHLSPVARRFRLWNDLR
jgi:hypothetical protein